MDILLAGLWYAAESYYGTKAYLETLSGKMSTLKQEARDKFLDEENEEFASDREVATNLFDSIMALVKDVTGPAAVILDAFLEGTVEYVSDQANATLTETSDVLAKEQFSHGSKEDARVRLKDAKNTFEVMAATYKMLPGDKVDFPDLPKTGGGRPVGSKNTGLTVGEYYFTLNGDKSPITTPSQFIYQATKELGGSNKNGSLSMAEFVAKLKEADVSDWTQNDWTLVLSDKVTIGFVRNV